MNVPFLAACLATGTVLPWAGAAIWPRKAVTAAAVTDVLIVMVLSYLPPFAGEGPPPPGGRGCGSLWHTCDPSWSAIGAGYAHVRPAAYVLGAAVLAWPFIVAAGTARRRTRPGTR